jgi:hypothetical protein
MQLETIFFYLFSVIAVAFAPFMPARTLAGATEKAKWAAFEQIVIDTTAPTVTSFSIPATSSSLTVSITSFAATDNVGVTGYTATESSTAPAAGAAGWSATAPAGYTFAAEGAKTLYGWAKDAAGNVSASRSATTTITFAFLSLSF